MPIVLKSGSLSLLELSGPVLACNGIALSFTFVFGDGRVLILVARPACRHLVTSVRLYLEFYQKGVNVNVFRGLRK